MLNTDKCERYWRIEEGDVLTTLASLGDNSFDGVLTDPPYGLRFMEKLWDDELPSVEIWQEILRVCKPGAMLLTFGCPQTFDVLGYRMRKAGWQRRGGILWLYGEGMPHGQNIAKAIDRHLGDKREVAGERITLPATPEAKLWDGYGTALKPGWEPILMAMKPLQGTFAKNAITWGCGGLNIDACRVGTDGGTTRSHQAPYPRKPDGTEDRSQCWARTGHEVVPIAKGRWPANVILDEKAADLLDQQVLATKSRRRCVEEGEDEGGPSRFFYCAKASRRERQGNPHPTVKPLPLCQYLAKLILPPGRFRKLLVPYCGSGSEMIGAMVAGWDYVVGIEREAEYVSVARKRLAALNAA